MLEAALGLLDARGAAITARSRVHETEPFGVLDQPPFLNQAARVEWAGSARGLHALGRSVELVLGRQERRRWGPREIDIDLVLFGAEIVDEPDLHIPHLGLPERLFFLEPLLEIDPGLRDPRSGRPLSELRDHILDR